MYSKERMQLNELVAKKDKESILKWLQSTNTEKQMFAVEGFLKLMKSENKFSQKELDLFNNVTNKKTTAATIPNRSVCPIACRPATRY